MEKITVNNLPKELTPKILKKLAIMATEFPITNEWRAISKVLTDEQQILVNNEISNIHIEKKKAKDAMKTEEEKAKEAAWWKAYYEDPDPHKFYGNMGQPETAEDFKNRYGIWPPNYKPDEEKKKNE